MVVADPPFVVREVWQKYKQACDLLLKPDAKFLCTTPQENIAMMAEVMNLRPITFKPRIPGIVYQFLIYTNIDDEE